MTEQDYETQVAAFLRAKGVTKCPTAFAVPTHASLSEGERTRLREHDQERQAMLEQRRQARAARLGMAA